MAAGPQGAKLPERAGILWHLRIDGAIQYRVVVSRLGAERFGVFRAGAISGGIAWCREMRRSVLYIDASPLW